MNGTSNTTLRTRETLKAELEAAILNNMESADTMSTLTNEAVLSWVKNVLGSDWTAMFLCTRSLTFCQTDANGHPIFGTNIELSFDFTNGEFRANVGSTGSFDIGGERAQFYIALGKFLSGGKDLETLKTILRKYVVAFNNHKAVIREIKSRLAALD